MAEKLLTTGQAAKYCSVTPDTVLKWIRSGFLPARRTAGGHHRIDARDLQRVIVPTGGRRSTHNDTSRGVSRLSKDGGGERSFRYCWEFNGKGELLDTCRACPVYQMRAQRCYEAVKLTPGADHPRAFCKGDTCLECDYYQHVHGQSINVLVVSDDKALAEALKREAGGQTFNLEVTDCEYSCSAVVNTFRPDFAIVDCSLGPHLSRDIVYHLSEDPRIPFVRVILAGAEDEFPTECDKDLFAQIQRPFSLHDIADCVKGAYGEGLGA